MIAHFNVLEFVTPDCFSWVTCHCTLRHKQKTEIIHCFKNKRFKEGITSQLPCFFFKFVLNLVQFGATRPTFNYSFFIDLLQQVEKLILLFDAYTNS